MNKDKSRTHQPEKEAEELGGWQCKKAQGMELGQQSIEEKEALSTSDVSNDGSRLYYTPTDSRPDGERAKEARASNDTKAIDKSSKNSTRSDKGTFGTNAAKREEDASTAASHDTARKSTQILSDYGETAAAKSSSDHYSDMSGSSKEGSEVARSSATQARPFQVRPPRPDIPGAFAISGDNDDDATDDFTIDPTIESEPSLPRSMEPISAEAVDVEADNRAFDERLQQEVDRKLAEKEKNTAMAEVVNMRLCLCSPRVRRLSIAGTTLLIVAIVLAIVLALTLRPDPTLVPMSSHPTEAPTDPPIPTMGPTILPPSDGMSVEGAEMVLYGISSLLDQEALGAWGNVTIGFFKAHLGKVHPNTGFSIRMPSITYRTNDGGELSIIFSVEFDIESPLETHDVKDYVRDALGGENEAAYLRELRNSDSSFQDVYDFKLSV